ncbi:hypothetical protein KKF92_00420 [Patescibacteria group bacterium]|nr:hypothetical protein [Patescibacteria group bacterium]
MTHSPPTLNSKALWQVVKSRTSPHLNQLLLTGGLISTVVGLVMIFMLARTDPGTQDIRSQATEANLKAILTLQTPDLIQVGDTAPLVLLLQTTPGTQIDGVQLAILIPKAYFETPTIEPSPTIGLNLAYQTITTDTNNYLIKVIIIGQNVNQPVVITEVTPLLLIRAVAKQSGQTELTLDNNLSMATLFHTQPTQNVLVANLGSITIDDGTTPTLLPEPTPTIAPTQAVTPRPTPAPTLTPTPTLTPSPIPTTDPLLPSLKFSFKLQGVNRVDVITNAWVTISNQADPASAMPIQTAFVSNSAGVFWPIQPIAINHLILDDQTQYQIAVKTTTSLRKNLGLIHLTSTPNQTPSSWQNQKLMVGDFVQTGDNNNKIDISDIGWIFSRYNQLTAKAVGELTKLDVNYDGEFDISDIAIVLSNYTQLEINGD